MSIKIQRINNEIVKAIPKPSNVDKRPVQGGHLFPFVYGNTFLVAGTFGGKTCTTFKILKACATRDTTIIVFVSSFYADESWEEIRKYFQKKKINFIAYTSITDHGVNQLDKLIHELDQEEVARKKALEEEVAPKEKLILCDEDEEECDEKKKKSKFKAPKYMLVFDDISHELKDPSLVALLKKSRQWGIRCIVSTQYIHDCPPAALKQMAYFLVFKGQPADKLEKIQKDAALPISLSVCLSVFLLSGTPPSVITTMKISQLLHFATLLY